MHLLKRQAQAKVDRSRTIEFLAGLNDKYSSIRGQIIMKKPLPDLAVICNILDQDDSQRMFNSPVIPAAYHISSPSASTETQTASSPEAQSAASQGSLNAFQKKNNRPTCSHCGVEGHVIDRCYKLHGYPVGWKKANPFMASHLLLLL